jgi:Ca2+/H+ antiporter
MESDASLGMGIALIICFLVIPLLCEILSLFFDKNK